MSNSIPSTPRRQSQSDLDKETSGLASSPSLSKQGSESESDPGKSVQTPIMTVRQATKTPINPDTNAANSSEPSQAAMTSSSPYETIRSTGEEIRVPHDQANKLPTLQHTLKPYSRSERFIKAVTADGQLIARKYSESDIKELAAWLSTSPAFLRELVIVEGDMGDTGARVLTKALRGNTTVTDLKLINCGIGAQGAAALAEFLQGNPTLTTLNLTGNRIGNEGTIALANALKFNTNLLTLDLQFCFFNTDAAASLADALSANSTLRTLHVGGNTIGAEGTVALAEALRVNTTLKALHLNSIAIRADGAIALANALKFNTNLRLLDLQFCSLNTVAAASLADTLSVNSTLRALLVGNNAIGAEGAVALAEALLVNTTLTALHLNSNAIGTEGAVALASALKFNTNLRTLDLEFCSFNTEAAALIVDALTANTTLTSLNLIFNDFIYSTLGKKISDLLERNKRLRLEPYANASWDLLRQHSPYLQGEDAFKDVMLTMAEYLPNEVVAVLAQEITNTFRAPSTLVTTTTTNATVTTTTTTTTDSTIPTTLITSHAALATDSASSPPSMTQPTATAADINALLADPNPVVALSRWIDGHANPAAALNWVDPTNGYTLLHYAVAAQQGAVVRSLLARGIDRTKADKTNQTAAQLAQRLADSSSSQAVAAIAALLQ